MAMRSYPHQIRKFQHELFELEGRGEHLVQPFQEETVTQEGGDLTQPAAAPNYCLDLPQ